MAVACTQCGASIEPRAGERLLECPFCSTALVVDGSATLYVGAGDAAVYRARIADPFLKPATGKPSPAR